MAKEKTQKKPVTPSDPIFEDDPIENKVRKLQEEQIARVLAAIRKLPQQAIMTLRKEFGIIVPVRVLAKHRMERRWGYLCKRCLHQAFEFIGLQFSYQAGEQWVQTDSPPLGVPIEDLPWVQDHPKATHHGKDPFNLRCQFCGAEVMLNPDRTLIPKRIVLIESINAMWERREREAREREERWKNRRR